MNDDHITGYNVDLEGKDFVIQTYNNLKKKRRKLHFSEVLTHCFECILDHNIIFDIQECVIDRFAKEHGKELKKKKGYCWQLSDRGRINGLFGGK